MYGHYFNQYGQACLSRENEINFLLWLKSSYLKATILERLRISNPDLVKFWKLKDSRLVSLGHKYFHVMLNFEEEKS